MSELLTQTIAAAIGTFGFSVLYAVPKQYYFHCGVIGASGWLLYVVLANLAGLTPTEATFFATVLVILLARFAAVREKCPVTVFVITGIFPLVPGGGIYWTAYHLVMGEMQQALASGFSAVKAAIAIVLGIVAVFELPHRLFRLGRH